MESIFYNRMRLGIRSIYRSFATGTLYLAVMLTLIVAGCGNGKDNTSNFPKNFSGLSDSAKVEYMMSHVSPDSVARFICDASLGKIEGVMIDTLSNATLYAYENYHDDDLQSFSTAYDEYAEHLPLDEKMRLRKLAAQEDAMGMGYALGLEYVSMIRLDHKNASVVEAEIAALKRACDAEPEDSLTFERFMKGFKVALQQDNGSDVPEEIYKKYTL